MLEASRVLADHVAALPQPDAALDQLALHVLSRELDTAERDVLHRERIKALDCYDSNPEAAVLFATVGQQPAPPKEKAPAIAAWMTLASMMLNLDEAITHE